MEYNLEVMNEQDKAFKQYSLERESVIGIEKNEPFKLRFTNNSYNPVQVRLSVDGTDILTGAPASTKPTGKMWLVQPYNNMILSAWPESDKGGAKFIFTAQGKSVAVNTHGVMTGVGLIGAAVYVEAAPPRLNFSSSSFSYGPFNGPPGLYPMTYNNISGLGDYTKGVRRLSADARRSRGSLSKSSPDASKGMDFDYSLSSEINDSDDVIACAAGASFEKLAVGAGEQVKQQLSTVAGLTKPMLDYMLQVRYLPWKELQARLGFGKPGTNAFPGDMPQKHIDLSSVPKTASRQSVGFERFI